MLLILKYFCLKGIAYCASCVANCFVGEAEWQHCRDVPNAHIYYLEFSMPEIHAEVINYFRRYFGIHE